MNKLPAERRTQILSMMVEGMSIRAIARLTGASKNTIIKLMVEAGDACRAYQDQHVRGLCAKRIQCDEIWSFTYAKRKNVATAIAAPADTGDTWTWMALDADSKLIVSWLVGGRDAGYATEFMQDVADRLATRVQLTTDGHKACLTAVEDAFGSDVDYAQLVKLYGDAPDSANGRYSPADCTGVRKTAI
ncbi:MAG TPA: IS1 family transposase, partial [Candidatus Saccharibacteria bacterium]|nr:IS1 family transposase [Candidatus Saccharibacteria bacterium]